MIFANLIRREVNCQSRIDWRVAKTEVLGESPPTLQLLLVQQFPGERQIPPLKSALRK
jgi:hypothetical protein